jgi:hypothetical protein
MIPMETDGLFGPLPLPQTMGGEASMDMGRTNFARYIPHYTQFVASPVHTLPNTAGGLRTALPPFTRHHSFFGWAV